MAQSFLQIHNLEYRWPSQADRLIDGLSVTFEQGWTGIVGENGCGKTTLLRLLSGDLLPLSGTMAVPSPPLLCRQRTDNIPAGFEEFSGLPDSDAGRLASRLGIQSDWPWRWNTLSHGERKRAQVAVALWRNPEVLLVDEPANHLDADTRELLTAALEGSPGIGLIVSHDRSLLDRLCSHCLFLESGFAVMRPGGVSVGLEEAEKEDLACRRERDEALREYRRLRSERRCREREAAAAHRKRSKRNLSLKDSDGREKIDRARVTGRDGRAGALAKQLDGRLEQARSRVESAGSLKRRIEGGVTLGGTASRSDSLAGMDAGEMPLGDGRRLCWPDVEIRPGDRIALTGPNGSGKSCFLRCFLDAPKARRDSLLYIPQEITAEEGERLIDETRNLSRGEKGELFSAVDRLGSDPVRLMESRRPSPGEARKLMLARGLAAGAAWVVMDEPTNHMDLFSMRHLEAALGAYGGALLLVSHDRHFLEAVTDIKWTILCGESPGENKLDLL